MLLTIRSPRLSRIAFECGGIIHSASERNAPTTMIEPLVEMKMPCLLVKKTANATKSTTKSIYAAEKVQGSRSIHKHKTPILKIKSSSLANRDLAKAEIVRYRDAVARQATKSFSRLKDLNLDDGKAFSELQASTAIKLRQMARPGTFGFDGGLTKTGPNKAVPLTNCRKMRSTKVTHVSPYIHDLIHRGMNCYVSRFRILGEKMTRNG